MANKLAIANGNWSAGSTWNDGVIPTADDDVTINGSYVVTITTNDVYAKTLTVSENAKIQKTTNDNVSLIAETVNLLTSTFCIIRNLNIVADVYVNSTIEVLLSTNITGNITIDNGGLMYGWYSGIIYNSTIVGNITVNGGHIAGSMERIIIQGKITVNSTVTSEVFAAQTRNASIQITEIESYSNYPIFANVRQTRQATPMIFGDIVLHNAPCFFGGYIQDSQTYIYFNGKVEIPNGDIFPVQSIQGQVFVNSFLKTKNIPRIINAMYYFGDSVSGIQTNEQNAKLVGLHQDLNYPEEESVASGVQYGIQNEYEGRLELPQPSTVLKDVEYGGNVGTLEVIALSGATATAENISVVNLTEQEVNRVKNCATVSTVQKCFEDFKE